MQENTGKRKEEKQGGCNGVGNFNWGWMLFICYICIYFFDFVCLESAYKNKRKTKLNVFSKYILGGVLSKVLVKFYRRWDEIPAGWYIEELATGNQVYIPVETWKQDARRLEGGRCVWIQKDKLCQVVLENF